MLTARKAYYLPCFQGPEVWKTRYLVFKILTNRYTVAVVRATLIPALARKLYIQISSTPAAVHQARCRDWGESDVLLSNPPTTLETVSVIWRCWVWACLT